MWRHRTVTSTTSVSGVTTPFSQLFVAPVALAVRHTTDTVTELCCTRPASFAITAFLTKV
jgi:hypothetical protein